MLGLLTALIVYLERPSAATGSPASADAEPTADHARAYAAFVAELLDETEHDDASSPTSLDRGVLEHVDAAHVASVRDVENIAQDVAWDAQRIQSILSSRARSAPGADVHVPASLSLLLRLIDADVDGARRFLRAVQAAGIRPSSLIDEPPSAHALVTIQTLLTPEAASHVRLLLRMLSMLPPGQRPGPDAHVHTILVREILDHHADPEVGPAFVETLLRQLVGAALGPGTRDTLAPSSPAQGDEPVPGGYDSPPVSGETWRDDVASYILEAMDAPGTAEGGHDSGIQTALLTIAGQLVDAGESPAVQVQRVIAALARAGTPEDGERARDTGRPSADSPDDTRALDWLRHGDAGPDTASPQRLPDDALRHAILRVVDRAPDTVHRILADRVGDPRVRQQWATVLSDSELVRIAFLLEPRQHRELLDAAELLFSAWLDVAPDLESPLTRRSGFWSFFLEFLSEGDRSTRVLERLVDRFFRDVGARASGASPASLGIVTSAPDTAASPGAGSDRGERLVRAASRIAEQAGHATLVAILDRDRATLLSPGRKATPAPDSGTLAFGSAASPNPHTDGGDAPAPGSPWLAKQAPIFARYDRVEALRYYLRHGVLPWSAALRDPALTVADTLGVLAGLPRSLVQTLVQDLGRDERAQVWRRAIREVPHAQLLGLLTALIAYLERPSAATGSPAPADAEPTADHARAYAAFVAGLLDETEHDDASSPTSLDRRVLEHVDAAHVASVRDVENAAQDVAWDAQRIQSILSSRARSAPGADAHVPTSLSLLLRLIDADVDGARRFLRVVQAAGLRPSSLIDEPPSAHALVTIQTLLTPDAASYVRLLLRTLSMLPPAQRPGPDVRVHAILVREILDRHAELEHGPAFVETILRQLFGPGLAPVAPDRLESSSPAPREPLSARSHDTPTGEPDSALQSAFITIAGQLVDAGEFPAVRLQRVIAAFARAWAPPGEDEQARETARPSAASADDERALDWLRHGDAGPGPGSPQRLPDDALRHVLLRVLDRAPDTVRHIVVDRVGVPQVRQQWATVLSDSELVRIAFLLEPRRHREFLDAAELLFSAWLNVAPDRESPLTRRSMFWSFFLEFLSESDRSTRALERLVDPFFLDVGARASGASPESVESGPPAFDTAASPEPRADNGERLMRTASRIAAQAGHTALLEILDRDRAALLARWRGDTPPPGSASTIDVRRPSPPRFDDSQARTSRSRGRTAFSMKEDEIAIGEPIYIANAGLILTHPFLPQLFQSLDMLERGEDGRRRLNADQVSRAVHLLQSLVDGRTSAPEPLLCLNKLLCGVPLHTPIERSIEATPRELDICHTLLTSMIANWPIISNTSVPGLQETFLQREGRLQRAPDGWRLLVQRKTVDVLIDHIPWSISTIVHAWMREPIFVTW